MTEYDYIRDGNAIYQQSFAIIRSEADLSRFSEAEADVAVRMIHAAGSVDAAQYFEFSPDFVAAARQALQNGAPIFCDAEMVSRGVTAARLPANNEVICTLRDPRTAEIASEIGNTRSAAAIRLWGERMAGSVVAIGNGTACRETEHGDAQPVPLGTPAREIRQTLGQPGRGHVVLDNHSR